MICKEFFVRIRIWKCETLVLVFLENSSRVLVDSSFVLSGYWLRN